MSPLEIGIIAVMSTALIIYMTVMLVKHFKKKNKNKKEDDD